MKMATTPGYMRKAIEKYNNKFDRFTVNFPKGYKDIIKNDIGMNCSAYINMLVSEDLRRRGLLPAAQDPKDSETETGPDGCPFD